MASKTINELTLKLNADMAELKKDLASAKKQLSGMNKYMKDFGAGLKAAFSIGAIAMAGKELLQFGKEAVQLGGQLAGVKNAFDKLNDPGLLNELREATKGTVSDLELMKTAVKFNEFQIPIDKMATSLAFATMQGQKMGESVDYMVESITTGLARESLPIIDNLGIKSIEIRKEMELLGKGATITSAVFSIMNKRLEENGGIIETSATITARWAARWDNMKAGVGLLINNALVKIAPILEEIRTFFVDLWETSTKFIIDTYNGYVDLYNESVLFRSVVESIGLTFRVVWESIKLFFNLFIDQLKNTGRLLAYVINPKNWGDGFGEGLKNILFKNGSEIAGDVKKWGTNIGTSFKESIENTKSGNASYITINDIISSGAVDEVKTKAKEISKAVKDALRPSADSGSIDFLAPIKASIPVAMGDITKLAEYAKSTMTTVKNSTIEASIGISDMLTDVFVSIGEGLGDLFSGQAGSLKSFFGGILNIILGFAESLGKQMIALGTATIALKALMKNPWTAIAAGIGLIAITKIIKNRLNDSMKFAQGGIVPGSSFSGDKVNIMANSGEMILNKGQQANLFNMIGAGKMQTNAGVLTARVSGNDLLFILEQTKQKQAYSY